MWTHRAEVAKGDYSILQARYMVIITFDWRYDESGVSCCHLRPVLQTGLQCQGKLFYDTEYNVQLATRTKECSASWFVHAATQQQMRKWILGHDVARWHYVGLLTWQKTLRWSQSISQVLVTSLFSPYNHIFLFVCKRERRETKIKWVYTQSRTCSVADWGVNSSNVSVLTWLGKLYSPYQQQ